MKRLTYVWLFLIIAASLWNVTRIQAATVVGNESYTISWHGTKDAEKYIVWYGQADTRTKDSTISPDELRSDSRMVRLNYLKPCTTYMWNVQGLRGGQWSWLWSSDQFFTTGGTCPDTKVNTGSQVTTATGVKATIAGNSSAVITWTPVNGAQKYNVYYKLCTDAKYNHAVQVPDKGSSVTLNYLNPAQRYCYRIAAVVGGKEMWMPEKEIQLVSPVTTKPVLGVQTYKPSPLSTGMRAPQLAYTGSTGGTTPSMINQWTQVRSHTGNMWKAPTSAVTGKVNWSAWVASDNKFASARQFEVYYKECGATAWQNGVITPGNARELTLQYLKTGVGYCYKVSTTISGITYSKEGTVTLP